MPSNDSVSLPFANSHAFIIGNDNYQEVSKLASAVKDARDIAKLLGEVHGYKIHALYDATQVQMEELFAAMPNIVNEDDRVVFYFAGHGIAVDSAKDPEGYLVPVDAASKGKEKLVPMDLLHNTLLKLPCKHGLLVLDCCFAGSFKWSTGFRAFFIDQEEEEMYEERFMRFVKHPAWQVITSSAHDQKALDLIKHNSLGMRENLRSGQPGEGGNSPFAHALKQAINLEGRADVVRGKRSDGVITASELYIYIREIVEDESRRQGTKQSPAIFTLSRHDTKGEFIFIHPGHTLNLPKAPNLNPYRGLSPYGQEEQDARTFFGRSNAIRKMADKLTQSSILVVSAPSGQGKSSVVKAGLFPFLKKTQGYEDEQFQVLRPGNRAPEKWEFLDQVDPSRQQAILIDQYEELFTEAAEWSASFEGKLLSVSDKIIEYAKAHQGKPSPLKLILTLRSDFEWQLKMSAFGKSFWAEDRITSFLYRLPPMELEELREAMVKPARVVACEFESEELVNQVLEEIHNAPGALPLLSFTLHQLYELRDRDQRLFTRNAYVKDLGGINGALSKHADAIYESLPDEAHQDFMRKLMLRMVRLNDGNYSRRRAYLQTPSGIADKAFIDELNYPDHLDGVKDTVLGILEKALLVIRDQDDFGPYVEPMHDSLINFWPRCLQWVKDFGRENLVLQRQLWQAVVEHHQWEKPIYGTADGSEPKAPLWDNNPKLQQVQVAITDPKDEWLCKKGWADKSIASISYLLWERDPSKKQMEEMEAWNWFFKAAGPKKLYQKIRKQMDHWLNEEELAFVKKSFEAQRSEIEQLTRERDDARATALAAKARQIYPEDHTIALNLAYAGYRTTPNEEAVSALSYILNAPNSHFYQRFDGHTESVNTIAFSPDGTSILSGSKDKTLRLWEVKSGKLIKSFTGHTDAVSAVAFSPNGTMILSGSNDKGLRLWDVKSGETAKKLEGHTGPVKSVAFSPDGASILSGSADQSIRLWAVESGQLIKSFNGHTDDIWSVAFSPDGNWIVSGSSDQSVRLWGVESGQPAKTFKGHTALVCAVAFSPDGKMIASGSADQSLRLWSAESGQLIKSIEGHTESVNALAFSPDGKQIVSGSVDYIRLWSAESGQLIKSIKAHADNVWTVAFSPDGTQIASGSFDQTVRLWPVEAEQNKGLEGADFVTVAAFSADGGQALCGSMDNTLRLYAVKSGQLAKSFPGTAGAFSPDGARMVTGSAGQPLQLWATESGQLIKSFEGHTDAAAPLAFSSDGTRVISGSASHALRLWSAESGQMIKSFEGHTDTVTSLAFSPDGTQIISGSADQSIRLWSIESGQLIKSFKGHADAITSLAFSPDGALVISGSADFTLRLWSVETMQLIHLFEGHAYPVSSVALSPDGKLILSGSADTTLRLWSTESGQEINSFEGHMAPIVSGPSHDGTQIACVYLDGNLSLRKISLLNWDPGIYKLNPEERKKYKVTVDY